MIDIATRETFTEDAARPIVKLYADGGVIRKNPSAIGGTWAWCGVTKDECRIIERGGFVPAPEGRLITNNHTEFIAATLALEAMPKGWSGVLCSDSQITLGRLFEGWRIANLPRNVYMRGISALRKLSDVKPLLLQGHPTKKDLARGIGAKRGYPVSEHNVWCDKECGRQAELYLRQLSIPPIVLEAQAQVSR